MMKPEERTLSDAIEEAVVRVNNGQKKSKIFTSTHMIVAHRRKLSSFDKEHHKNWVTVDIFEPNDIKAKMNRHNRVKEGEKKNATT
jgi:hypothetical protein